MSDWQQNADLAIKAVQALLTGGLGYLAWKLAQRQVAIAHKQAETAGNKLKLDLYERRYEVYLTYVKLTESVLKENISHEEMEEAIRTLRQVEFLFKYEMSVWMHKLIGTCVDLVSARENALSYLGPGHEVTEDQKTARKKVEVLTKELKLAQAEALIYFNPYLDFQSIS